MYTYIVRSSQINLLTLLETSSSLCSSSYFLNLHTQNCSIKLGALAVFTMAACVEVCNQEKPIFFCSSGMESSPYPRRASQMLAWHQIDFHRPQYNMDKTLKQSCSVLIVHPYWNEDNLYQLTNSLDRWFTNFKAIGYFQLFVAKISRVQNHLVAQRYVIEHTLYLPHDRFSRKWQSATPISCSFYVWLMTHKFHVM